MKLRTLMEKEERYLIFDIPSIKGDYYKRENKVTRKKDLKSAEYKGFTKLLSDLGEKKWDEDTIIDFLYATVTFIYWDTKRGDYNYLNTKDTDDTFFKNLTHISYKKYNEEK